MPYHIVEHKGEYCLAKKDGSLLQCHSTKDKARKAIYAIMMSESKRSNDESVHEKVRQGGRHIIEALKGAK